jgi:hypothetical protein
MRGHKRSFSRLVITRSSGGKSSVNQQRRAGGKFRCAGSKVKDGHIDVEGPAILFFGDFMERPRDFDAAIVEGHIETTMGG